MECCFSLHKSVFIAELWLVKMMKFHHNHVTKKLSKGRSTSINKAQHGCRCICRHSLGAALTMSDALNTPKAESVNPGLSFRQNPKLSNLDFLFFWLSFLIYAKSASVSVKWISSDLERIFFFCQVCSSLVSLMFYWCLFVSVLTYEYEVMNWFGS